MIWGKCIKMDSIRENRTKEDVAEEIRAMFAEDIEGKLCVVLVEGSDDVQFMKIVLEDNVVCIESPYGGKHGLNDLMTYENPTLRKKEVIAVRDKDYENVENFPDKVFAYDGCCLETMILSNSDIAENFHRGNYRGNLDKECYLLDIMQQIAPYSMLRKLNDLGGGDIVFKNGGFGALITEEGLKIDKVFERVNQLDKLELCTELANEVPQEELWNITNGRDLCTYLGLVSKLGKKTLGENDVREILFTIYRKNDFQTTKLFHSILEHQNANMLKFVSE